MSKASKIIIAVVAVVVIAGVTWMLTGNKSDAPTNTPAQTNKTSDQPAAATITYTDNGFSPTTTKVKSGDTVKVVNQSGGQLQFASDPHPTHTDDPELNAGDIATGDSKSFVVTTKGDWGFHNHYDHSKSGRITVE